MAKCLNCKREIGCTCNRRVSKSGKSCCKYCVSTCDEGTISRGSDGYVRMDESRTDSGITVIYKN